MTRGTTWEWHLLLLMKMMVKMKRELVRKLCCVNAILAAGEWGRGGGRGRGGSGALSESARLSAAVSFCVCPIQAREPLPRPTGSQSRHVICYGKTRRRVNYTKRGTSEFPSVWSSLPLSSLEAGLHKSSCICTQKYYIRLQGTHVLGYTITPSNNTQLITSSWPSSSSSSSSLSAVFL